MRAPLLWKLYLVTIVCLHDKYARPVKLQNYIDYFSVGDHSTIIAVLAYNIVTGKNNILNYRSVSYRVQETTNTVVGINRVSLDIINDFNVKPAR